MAKELFIMFIYDTQRCQREEDDPQDAVLYFHPTWVSEQQRLALCGQLMGATQFFLSAFSCPRVISLNSGKFVVQQFGQYILTVGTDRNIPDWILEQRADSLHCLVQFYHKDFDTISSVSETEGIFFNEKLHQIFETYVPIIQFAGNIFGTIPTVRLPKSASSVFLEALQILHCFQAKGVLGGTVLYQNKVVATQLSSALTKRLVSTDPYRIKSSAEHVATPFHLPVGVQLLYVYVSKAEYKKLLNDTVDMTSAFQSVPQLKACPRKVIPVKTPSGKEPMTMKRDTSRIFTVPEEDGELDDHNSEEDKIAVPSVPTVLSDISDISDLKEVTESEEENTDSKQDVSPMAESFSNYVSTKDHTPLDDINISKVLHAKVLSICCGTEGEFKKEDTKKEAPPPDTKHQHPTSVDSPKTKVRKSKFYNIFPGKNNRAEAQSSSLNDLNQNSRSASKTVPMRCYSFGLPQLTREMCEEGENDDIPEKLPPERYFYNTIADPMHPCFRDDGLPISRSLFHEHVSNHYHLLRGDRSPGVGSDGSSENTSVAEKTENGRNSDNVTHSAINSTNSVKGSFETSQKEQLDKDKDKQTSFKQEVYRRSLSLPLKTIASSINSGGKEDVGDANSGFISDFDSMRGALESPILRTRPVHSLQLTPLMSKLSLLAGEDRSFYSHDPTPCDLKDFVLPGPTGEKLSSRRGTLCRSETSEGLCDAKSRLPETEKIVLYVCGQQNMALTLLMEEKLSQDPDMIHSLWETGLSALGHLELHLRQCLEHLPQGEGMDGYSYICLDPNWDMLQRGGSWGALELDVVSCLHHDFSRTASLTEVVIRCEDSTVYGYQCGKTEVFYQQLAGSTHGLPTPADLMGTVPLKAKRRLERDHGIILL